MDRRPGLLSPPGDLGGSHVGGVFRNGLAENAHPAGDGVAGIAVAGTERLNEVETPGALGVAERGDVAVHEFGVEVTGGGDGTETELFRGVSDPLVHPVVVGGGQSPKAGRERAPAVVRLGRRERPGEAPGAQAGAEREQGKNGTQGGFHGRLSGARRARGSKGAPVNKSNGRRRRRARATPGVSRRAIWLGNWAGIWDGSASAPYHFIFYVTLGI